ncbi:MAG: hypothetical protein Tsb0021_05340 [Chlamydiales bacterium]
MDILYSFDLFLNKVRVFMSTSIERPGSVPIPLSIRVEQSFQTYHGRIIKLLDPLNRQNACSEIAKRILLLFSALIIYPVWGFKCLIDRCINFLKFSNQSQTQVTLASEVEHAKKDILDRVSFDDFDFNGTESAKLFIVIKHEGNVFSKSFILLQDVNKEQILNQFDILVNNVQEDIIFNPNSKTEVVIGILAKGREDHQGQPVFSYKLTAHATVHYGEISKPGFASFTNVLATRDAQNSFCDLMGINQAPQIDAQGNFI